MSNSITDKEVLDILYNIYEKAEYKTLRRFKDFTHFQSSFFSIFVDDKRFKILFTCFQFETFNANEIKRFFRSNQIHIEKILYEFELLGLIKSITDDTKSSEIYSLWVKMYPNSSKKPVFYTISDTAKKNFTNYIFDKNKVYNFLNDIETNKITQRKTKYNNIHSSVKHSKVNNSEHICLKCFRPITKECITRKEFRLYPKGYVHLYCQKEADVKEVQEWMQKK